ncbi:hypothetical protein Bca4012_025969 [Brassica carinata]|uniref:Uncharacterized protein n=1 Tax=Brassica carinata TaxID=52824 RepID=A0A8X7VHQ6_BRACI|nr:hypothetical protein Bca52824_022989 [Brassica carinata]
MSKPKFNDHNLLSYPIPSYISYSPHSFHRTHKQITPKIPKIREIYRHGPVKSRNHQFPLALSLLSPKYLFQHSLIRWGTDENAVKGVSERKKKEEKKKQELKKKNQKKLDRDLQQRSN